MTLKRKAASVAAVVIRLVLWTSFYTLRLRGQSQPKPARLPHGALLEHVDCRIDMGLSENVVYPYTQWLMITIPTKWL